MQQSAPCKTEGNCHPLPARTQTNPSPSLLPVTPPSGTAPSFPTSSVHHPLYGAGASFSGSVGATGPGSSPHIGQFRPAMSADQRPRSPCDAATCEPGDGCAHPLHLGIRKWDGHTRWLEMATGLLQLKRRCFVPIPFLKSEAARDFSHKPESRRRLRQRRVHTSRLGNLHPAPALRSQWRFSTNKDGNKIAPNTAT